ncbi:FkbM family methyltransferase [Lentibacter algarum]|uniref:FkbM family methyltransferase n=1 Tax=Lentibacter algarum TaxID=576131 RepID=UPI001C07E11C|nr:FkbM family methyltransferase [Lentibacter algarum]MBU2980657.1 FkbM family methyltransferase [Lentibacter algarum]
MVEPSSLNQPILSERFESYPDVQVRTCDEVALQHFAALPVDVLKLDVEGHELEVLQGANSVLERCSAVQFEFGRCNIDTRTFFRDFFQFFAARGFQLYRISPLGPIRLAGYREHLESYMTCNFIAVAQR